MAGSSRRLHLAAEAVHLPSRRQRDVFRLRTIANMPGCSCIIRAMGVRHARTSARRANASRTPTPLCPAIAYRKIERFGLDQTRATSSSSETEMGATQESR